jgi:hypothetical protein
MARLRLPECGSTGGHVYVCYVGPHLRNAQTNRSVSWAIGVTRRPETYHLAQRARMSAAPAWRTEV